MSHPIPVDFPPALEVFGRHRSVRFFLPDPLARGDLDLIVEAGRRAPTDAQGHMYACVCITDATLRDRLATLCADQQHIRDAAEFFVVCLDVHRLRRLIEYRGLEWGMRERIALLYGATDATMVAQNMVVAAESLGYGACYIGAVQNNVDVIAQELSLPPGVLPIYGLCIGVIDPAHYPPLKPRIPRDLCFFENSYPADFPAQALEAAYAAMRVKRDWLDSIGVYFATDGTMEHREPIMARAWRQQELDPRPVE
ncbi:nitroreductase family protein [Caldilinea sp.]|uniref:nitroreductase family protein n=1 Tax=Caldilinea sp. TaxID=2293560 RepID=UPI002BAA3ADA|nr:nitroreductase family protein [Caldilinea sp.]